MEKMLVFKANWIQSATSGQKVCTISTIKLEFNVFKAILGFNLWGKRI